MREWCSRAQKSPFPAFVLRGLASRHTIPYRRMVLFVFGPSTGTYFPTSALKAPDRSYRTCNFSFVLRFGGNIILNPNFFSSGRQDVCMHSAGRVMSSSDLACCPVRSYLPRLSCAVLSFYLLSFAFVCLFVCLSV